MKKIIVMLFAVAMVSSAYAMPPRGGFHGGFAPHTTVIIRGGYSPFYSPFGYYGYPYYGYGYGYPYAAVPSRPTKLDLQVQDIKNDYADKIASVKSDHDLSRKERREKVREFKAERNDAIRNAKVNYYKS